MYSPPTLRASYKTAGLITGGIPSVSARTPSQIQQPSPKHQLPALVVPKTDLKESAPAQSLIDKGAGLLEQYSIEPFLASSRSQYGLAKPAAGTFGGWVDPEVGDGDGVGSPGATGQASDAFGDTSTSVSIGQVVGHMANNPAMAAISTMASIAMAVTDSMSENAATDAANAAASNSATAIGVGNPNGALGDSVASQAEAASPASQAANAAAQAAAVANNAVTDAVATTDAAVADANAAAPGGDSEGEGGNPGDGPGDAGDAGAASAGGDW